jgi:2-phosphosulfolactate phosphatase
MRTIRAHLLPALTNEEELGGATVVIIDVLRASTTIIHALAAGAECVIPCLKVEEAQSLARLLGDSAVLGGERDGVKIPGFDLGNSPCEYTPALVRGKTVVFTTTNGTRALLCCRRAARVLIGAFVNFSAVCRVVADSERVVLLCAGTRDHITREDVLFAGTVVHQLTREGPSGRELNDEAQLARGAWLHAASELSRGASLANMLRDTRGGRNLLEIGLDADIQQAAAVDVLDLVPEFVAAAGRIQVA